MVWAAQLCFGNKAFSKTASNAADVKNDRQDRAVVVYFEKLPEKRKGKWFSFVESFALLKGSISLYEKPNAIGKDPVHLVNVRSFLSYYRPCADQVMP